MFFMYVCIHVKRELWAAPVYCLLESIFSVRCSNLLCDVSAHRQKDY